jgi:hypothetical protein
VCHSAGIGPTVALRWRHADQVPAAIPDLGDHVLGGSLLVWRLAPLAARARPVTSDERERAWAAVHDAVAQMPGWAVGPCVYHGDGALWHITAIDLRPRGRQAKREAITATGATEVGALEALAALLEARQTSGR